MKLLLLIFVIVLTIVPLFLMQTIVTRTVQLNILHNSTVLTQGIIERSRLYLNRFFMETKSLIQNMEMNSQLIGRLNDSGPSKLIVDDIRDIGIMTGLIGNLVIFSTDYEKESVFFDLTYGRQFPVSEKITDLFTQSETGRFLNNDPAAYTWRGESPEGLTNAESSLWLYMTIQMDRQKYLVAASFNREELLKLLTDIATTLRSEVFLFTSEGKSFPEQSDFNLKNFSEPLQNNKMSGRFYVTYDSRKTENGEEKIIIQTYTDPAYDYSLITITPEKNLIRGFETIVRTTVLSLILLGLISIVAGFLFVQLFTRQIHILIEAVSQIGAGKNDIDLPASRLQIKESAVLTASIAQLADEVKSSRLNLEHKVQERTEELRNSLEELHMTRQSLIHSEKMAIMGRQGAKIAHEINNPISVAITASTHLESTVLEIRKKFTAGKLTKSDFDKLLAISAEVSDLVHRNLRQASSLIMGFKEFTSDQTREDKKVIRIANYIKEIINSYSYKLKNTPYTIELICSEDLEVEVTPSVLYQTITNLINNSLLHGFEGRNHGEISIDVSISESNLILKYKDDGNGISQENISQIYKPFFTTKPGEGGTGLGLNIIRDIIEEELNGTISCESRTGEGALFTISFPVDQRN